MWERHQAGNFFWVVLIESCIDEDEDQYVMMMMVMMMMMGMMMGMSMVGIAMVTAG
jgi:Kef-type K+ transport system membrane component KefB